MFTSAGAQRLRGLAVAAAVAAAGTVTVFTPAAPASAAPCTSWKLESNALVINQDNGIVVMVDWPANMNRPTEGSFTATGGRIWRGSATGGIVGGNKLDFTINFEGPAEFGPVFGNADPIPQVSNHYTGDIEEVMAGYGKARGTTINDQGVSNSWVANETFVCADAPAAAPAPPAEKQVRCTDGRILPPDGDCIRDKAPEEKAPTDAVRMVITKQGLSVKVTVTSTANIPGRCSYDANEAGGLVRAVNEVFDIDPNGTKELTFPAPLPLQSWRVVVACSGDFKGQNVEFGRQVQNI